MSTLILFAQIGVAFCTASEMIQAVSDAALNFSLIHQAVSTCLSMLCVSLREVEVTTFGL